ncbi:ATP-dependent DNA helicase Q1 isoform X3 [Girardinichthys multiradiatus]|uniref:ATP-dependent DNA helicase Q1 isoform X3 n=1 Tax=Girardinichthys multiradiatus TaxID=208333 RepID=UPI001FAB7AA8|nr:ATP-dependent DNA helicase Q1 isoform X3 [Girardinichthys multiradiatus]
MDVGVGTKAGIFRCTSSKEKDRHADTHKDVQAELDSVEAELELVELQITELLDKQAQLTSQKNALLLQLEEACGTVRPSSSKSLGPEPMMSKQELQQYDGTDFPWSKDVEQHLKNSFHLSKFRPLQLRAINLTMAGKDLFLVMPTGRGKSLCFQLPAVCSKGFTLVITPLVSLMEDQIMYLKSIDISAVMLNASSSKEHAKLVMAGMMDPKAPFKLVYVTPEKIAKSKLLMSRLEKAYNAKLLSRIAVDEVHCCSQWGHDFRPDYKLLGILKRQFPMVPLFGLTATATSSVLKDCEKILCVQQPVTITSSFNRTNLYYEVRIKDSNNDALMSDITSLIKGKYKDQSGIVYVFSQKDAEMVSSELKKRDISAYPYHANMDPEEKSKVHRRWTSNKIQVVVATVAFGMGIDKPDVRFVIHHTISKSIENYYQESGRAGRDDLSADCIVYFGFPDVFRISTMVVMENVGHQKLLQMVAYCQNVDRCRRSLMAVHFDEVWDDEGCNQMCDTCCNAKGYASVDITQHARQVVLIVEQAGSMDEKVTPLKLVETWMGRGPAKLRKMIQTTTLSRLQAEAVIISLLLQGYLREDYSFTPYATYFYVKLGRKAPLLKKETHTINMNMWKAEAGPSAKTSAIEVGEAVVCMSLDPTVLKNRSPPQTKQKLMKEQRKHNLKPTRQPEGAQNQPSHGQGEEEKDKRRPFMSQNQTVGTSWRSRRKRCSNIRAADPSFPRESPVLTVSSSPSQGSVISETAAEELCDLRNYYSKQLKRINYISHEHLGAPLEPGVLSCIREPLRGLRLPQRVTIAQTARSLWTRVSGRRKLVRH